MRRGGRAQVVWKTRNRSADGDSARLPMSDVPTEGQLNRVTQEIQRNDHFGRVTIRYILNGSSLAGRRSLVSHICCEINEYESHANVGELYASAPRAHFCCGLFF